MEITVTMTSDDFMEFMEWKKERRIYENRIKEAGDWMETLASKVLKTLEECGEGRAYKIASQEAAAELVESAIDVFA